MTSSGQDSMSGWDLSGLQDDIERRRKLSEAGPLDEIVLAFAQWRMAAEETGDTHKQKLDELLDRTDADAWGALKDMVGVIDDRLLKELMAYSGRRAMEQMAMSAKELLNAPDGLDAPPPGPPTKRKKKRMRM